MAYAEGTDVPVERSRAEIERLLTRYGAQRFMSGWDRESATIAFEANGRRVRFVTQGNQTPERIETEDLPYTMTATGTPGGVLLQAPRPRGENR